MNVRRVVPIVTVDDVALAVEQYSAVLGLDVVMDLGWIATLADAHRRHQVSVMTVDATAAVNPSMSVEVADVDAAHAAAVGAGLNIVHPLSDEEWASAVSSLPTATATWSTC